MVLFSHEWKNLYTKQLLLDYSNEKSANDLLKCPALDPGLTPSNRYTNFIMKVQLSLSSSESSK